MDTAAVINEVQQSGNLSATAIAAIEEDRSLRFGLVQYFDTYKDRQFALDFLRILSDLRRNPEAVISGDSLMLACYILGKHQQAADCMRIWETKNIDFDTYCYIDGQLMVFAGVQPTIEYLLNQHEADAQNALEYITACAATGDFDHAEQYFKEIPWFV